MKITVESNPWSLPGPPIYIEGTPAAEERAREEAEARAAHATWAPGPAAYALLDRLREAVGHHVVVQGWAPVMFWLADEGPYPIRARCVHVLVRDDAEGHPRAYLVLQNVEVQETPRGYDGRRSLIAVGDGHLFPVHELYELVAESAEDRA